MSTFRTYLAEPGQLLAPATSALDLLTAADAFAADAGLDGAHIALNAVASIPLPVKDSTRGPRGWAPTLNPALFWHPLFWLPESLARPYATTAEDGEPLTEPLTVWGYRVATEVTNAGLYDATTGAWLDVLAEHSLDIADPAAQLQIATWLHGTPDAMLDAIDLTDRFTADLDASLLAALDNVDDVQITGWGFVAAEIAAAAQSALDDQNPVAQRFAVSELASIATLLLADCPPLSAGEEPPVAHWQGVLDRVLEADVPADVVEDDLRYLRDSGAFVAEGCGVELEAL